MSDATRDQYGNEGYRDDVWHHTTIENGTRLYRLDFLDDNGVIHGSSYYIDENALIDGDYISYDEYGIQHFDVEKYCDDYQIAPNYGGYKNHISVFDVPEEVPLDAEEGNAENNWEYGHGGGRQLFINSENESRLEPVNETIEIDEELRSINTETEMHSNHDENDKIYKYKAKVDEMQAEAIIADQIERDRQLALGEKEETLTNVANEAELPLIEQANAQSNEQTQDHDNTVNY